MKNKLLILIYCLFVSSITFAKDSNTDISKKINILEKQMLEMQAQYDARIAEMQETINELKAQQKENESDDEEELFAQLKAKSEQSQSKATSNSQSGLNISAVLDFNYYHDNSEEGLGHMREEIAGFGVHNHNHEDHHHHGNENGFNLGHVELGLSTEVDPYFRAWTTLAFEDGEDVEVEEAVIQSTSLSNGFNISAGKFKSGIGRLNRQHNHAWDFIDAPLVYEKFFGSHGLAEKGLQLTWLAPTKSYLLFGAEAGNGDNEVFCNYVGEEGFPKHSAPRLYTAFMKYSPEIGPRQSLQLGLSYAKSKYQREEEDHDTDTEYFYDGNNKIYGFDFIYKHYGLSDKNKGDLTIQGEYFYRDCELELQNDFSKYRNKQDGFYLQAIYGIAPRWRLGARYDCVGLKNHCEEFGKQPESFGKSHRIAGMIDYKLSEYSLLRFQFGRSNFCTGEEREKAWEYALQLQVSLGSHPAHEF